MIATALIGLGSNIEPRRDHLRTAVAAIREVFGGPLRCSPVFESRPLGPSTSNFLNAALACPVDREPAAVLTALHDIEAAMGRVRGERWAPRTIDLDLLAWIPDGAVRSVTRTGAPDLPHPGLADRDFVLQPLLHVWPQLEHDGRTVAELLARLPDDARFVIDGSASPL